MKKDKCYLCGKNNLKVIRTKLRYDISRNVFKCQDCGIVYLEPKEIDSKDYYQQNYRKFYSPVIGKTLNSREIFDIYFPYQQIRINEISHILNSRMKVLDVGSSAGYFLYALKDCVQQCIGIELNKENAKFANDELGIKTSKSKIS